jgi:transposase InsO family protein
MSRKTFSDEEIKELKNNKYTKAVSDKAITYTNDFKKLVVDEYNNGMLPREIFEKYGYDANIIGKTRIRSNTYRWRKAYEKRGILGLEDTRKNHSGRPLIRELTLEEKYERLQAKNKYLQAEIDLLKKLDGRERRRENGKISLKISEKFILIKETIIENNLQGMTSHLCEVAEVSRSGYYNYFSQKSVAAREVRKLKDEIAFKNILEAYKYKNRYKGIRQIKMTLDEHFKINYNVKRIIRLMHKYGLECPIRKANPYKRIMKATKEHRVLKNKLNRNFKQNIVGKVLLTDITYITYGSQNKRAYLSVIKDSSTNIAPAYYLSKNLKLDIVIKTIDQLLKNPYFELHSDAFIHSDQGAHYTSPVFQKYVKVNNLGQSMSRRGNCWDNAPMESFFGHMKDECHFDLCETYEELQNEIEDYFDYYNNDRGQWNLKKMTPVKFGNHLLNVA